MQVAFSPPPWWSVEHGFDPKDRFRPGDSWWTSQINFACGALKSEHHLQKIASDQGVRLSASCEKELAFILRFVRKMPNLFLSFFKREKKHNHSSLKNEPGPWKKSIANGNHKSHELPPYVKMVVLSCTGYG
jgi:hypothetical protein